MPRDTSPGCRPEARLGAARNRLLELALVLGALLLAACAGDSRQPRGVLDGPGDTVPLVLISLDGFRWDFMELAETPSLDRLTATGVRAERLVPVFPTKTFPNHHTIVTGLYPEHHGIVANNFYDPVAGARFLLADPRTHTLIQWWEGEPIWVTAEKQGLLAATYFWPGSETEFKGIRPTHWRSFDPTVPYEERIDQVLAWLDTAEPDRPDFVALYFSLVDTIAHSNDPTTSPRVFEAIRTVDAAVGRLLKGLSLSGIDGRVNLLLVSDHGMAPTSQQRVILLDDYIETSTLRISDWNPVASLWPDDDRLDQVYEALEGAHPHLRVFRKQEIPEDWHYREHRRIAPLLAVADEGWSISTRAAYEARPASFDGGNHGYDPSLSSMGALLIAAGPAFREGLVAPPLAAVDLYELMCAVLDLKPAPNDGDLRRVQHILRRQRPAE